MTPAAAACLLSLSGRTLPSRLASISRLAASLTCRSLSWSWSFCRQREEVERSRIEVALSSTEYSQSPSTVRIAASTFCGSSDAETVARSSTLLRGGAPPPLKAPSASRAHPPLDELHGPVPELLLGRALVGEALVGEGDRVPHPDRKLPLVPLFEARPAGRGV